MLVQLVVVVYRSRGVVFYLFKSYTHPGLILHTHTHHFTYVCIVMIIAVTLLYSFPLLGPEIHRAASTTIVPVGVGGDSHGVVLISSQFIHSRTLSTLYSDTIKDRTTNTRSHPWSNLNIVGISTSIIRWGIPACLYRVCSHLDHLEIPRTTWSDKVHTESVRWSLTEGSTRSTDDRNLRHNQQYANTNGKNTTHIR